MPYQIMYSSQASAPMTVAGLEQILADARTGNQARDVTGALVYVDGVFFQILEGEKDVLPDKPWTKSSCDRILMPTRVSQILPRCFDML